METSPYRLQAILQNELVAAKARLEEELIPIRQMVESLQKQVEEIRPSMVFSEEFLSAYSRLD